MLAVNPSDCTWFLNTTNDEVPLVVVNKITGDELMKVAVPEYLLPQSDEERTQFEKFVLNVWLQAHLKGYAKGAAVGFNILRGALGN